MSASQFAFGEPVNTHAWNGDATALVVCPSACVVNVFSPPDSVAATHELSEHQQRVNCIDWAPKTNKIVTCGADRNAFVWLWNDKSKKWEREMVALRINRAAICVRWAPNEQKFAVGTGSRHVCVCYPDEGNNFWSSKHVKKPMKSSVTALAWHPSSLVLAAGGTDMKCRLLVVNLKEVDGRDAKTDAWGLGGKKLAFAELVQEWTSRGWIHGINFSPSGDKVAWVAHDSSVNVVETANPTTVVRFDGQFLPLLSCLWLSEQSLVGAGHGCQPFMFSYSGGQLTKSGDLDQGEKEVAKTSSALSQWKNRDTRSQTGPDTSIILKTTHQNSISEIRAQKTAAGRVTAFSTCGLDGRVVIWTQQSLEKAVAGLKIV